MGYLTRLIKVKCDKGNMANYLNVETDHGVIWYAVDENGNVTQELPFMNANDHIGDVNLMCFGRCSSESNKVFGGKRSFHVGSLMDAAGMAIDSAVESIFGKEVGLCDGYMCTPYCSQPWFDIKEDVYLDGAPVLTGESKVTCYYGGVISYYVETKETEADNK